MKRFFCAMCIATILFVSSLAPSITVYADTLTAPDILHTFSLKYLGDAISMTSQQFLDLLYQYQQGLITGADYSIVPVDTSLPEIPLNSVYDYSGVIDPIGAMVTYYAINQGATWIDATSDEKYEETCHSIATNILKVAHDRQDIQSSENLLDFFDAVGSLIYHRYQNAQYYESVGMPFISNVLTSMVYCWTDICDSAELYSNTKFDTLNSYHKDTFALLSQSQYNDLFHSGYAVYCEDYNQRVTAVKVLNRQNTYANSLVYIASTGQLYWRNDVTNASLGSITTVNGYTFNYTNPQLGWTSAAGLTLTAPFATISANADMSTVMDAIRSWGNVYLPHGVYYYDGSAVDSVTYDTPYWLTPTEPKTVPSVPDYTIPFDWYDLDLDPTINVNFDIDININPPAETPEFPDDPSDWFPIDESEHGFNSVWHYVEDLFESTGNFFDMLGDSFNAIPNDVKYPFLGIFVLVIFGGIVYKLAG